MWNLSCKKLTAAGYCPALGTVDIIAMCQKLPLRGVVGVKSGGCCKLKGGGGGLETLRKMLATAIAQLNRQVTPTSPDELMV